MNKCKDPYTITTTHLIDALPVIGTFFTNLINSSLSQGTFPDCWKESTITPVAKVFKSTKPEQFRPINNMIMFEKPVERIVKDQLVHYVESNNILSKFQSGYRSGYSCESALNLVLNKWKESTDNGEYVLACYLDLKRAFETIDRRILLTKLHQIGVGEISLKWFSSYLENRKQRTKVETETSQSKRNNIGVPQGSIIGAFLFILYINDISSALEFCSLNMFADDTLIYICGKNLNELTNKLNSDLNKLFQWLCINKLKLNIDKTKTMILGKKVNTEVL